VGAEKDVVDFQEPDLFPYDQGLESRAGLDHGAQHSEKGDDGVEFRQYNFHALSSCFRKSEAPTRGIPLYGALKRRQGVFALIPEHDTR
jgi:hypothetical protein